MPSASGSPLSVTLPDAPLKLGFHRRSVLPRQATISVNSCVVILLSRYSWRLVHFSWRSAATMPHVSSG
eukprot:2573653-Prymnesium_polylepis.1